MRLQRLVAHGSICLRRLSGSRAGQVRFGRFLANPAVALERLPAGWAEPTRAAATGRHGLAIQDTRAIGFKTPPERRRAWGEIGKGTSHGLFAACHAGSGRRERRLSWPKQPC